MSAVGENLSLWPIHLKPHADELLSSWIVRLAYAYGMKVQSFSRQVFGRSREVWARDLDRLAPESVLTALSATTGVSAEAAFQTSLRSYEGTLFEKYNPNGNTRWLLPAGVFHRVRRRFGMQFCPLCLATDIDPYYRRRWRLAFMTVCDVHGCLMHDRCHQCGAPVVFHRQEMGDRAQLRPKGMTRCHACLADLSRAPAWCPPAPPGLSIVTLRSLATFPDLGWWFVGDRVIPFSHLYFDVLRHLLKLFSNRYGQALLDYVEAETGWSDVKSEQPAQQFEVMSVRERHRWLMAALWLLEDWPRRFEVAGRTQGLTQTRILEGHIQPFWFESSVRLTLGNGYYSPTQEEANNAMAYVAKTGEVTVRSVSTALGRYRDIVAIRPLRRPAKAKPMREGFELAIKKLEEERLTKLPGTVVRAVLERDRMMFLMMAMLDIRWPEICRLTVADAEEIVGEFQRGDSGLSSRLVRNLGRYLKEARLLLVRECDEQCLFPSANGRRMTLDAFRHRYRRLLH